MYAKNNNFLFLENYINTNNQHIDILYLNHTFIQTYPIKYLKELISKLVNSYFNII